MLRNMALLSLASSFVMSFGCVVVSDDEDDTSNDSNVTNADDGATGDGMDDGATAADGMDDGDTAAMDDTAGDTAAMDDTAGDTAAMDDTAGDETAGGGLCGWGMIDDKMITEGYTCGGMGEDPAMNIPLACPDIDLVVGDPCGDIEGEGCCDGDSVWFCSIDANGGEDVLATIACM